MCNKLHLVMPMAGRGHRFSEVGYDVPKPLIKIYDKPFFYWATESMRKFINLKSIDFIVLNEHIENYRIDNQILFFYPNARIHVIKNVTEGAVITCLNGINDINDCLPIVFNDCDHMFKSTELNSYINENVSHGLDGILLTFNSNESKYSFIEKNEYGDVIRTTEKCVISNEAICGCYYFKNKELFINSAEKYLSECNYDEYFMSGLYNIMIRDKKTVKSMKTDFHISFGVPSEYEQVKDLLIYKELL